MSTISITRIAFVFIFIISGISVAAQQFPDRSNAANRRHASPDNCNVTAKVLKVIPARRKVSKENCKTSPCLVKLKIIKVKAYGSAFPEKFSEGQKLTLNFVCPIVDNEDRSSDLKRGKIIDVSIKALPVMHGNDHEFKVYSYSANDNL